jgi:5-methylcytosine-specific restriction endonuclease McrA
MYTDKQLDDLFRKVIRLRDDYDRCPICRNRFNEFREKEVCHFIKRRYLKTRWEPENAIIGCSVCNHLDVDIEPVLIKRHIDTEALRRIGKSFGKPDREKIHFYLTEQLEIIRNAN